MTKTFYIKLENFNFFYKLKLLKTIIFSKEKFEIIFLKDNLNYLGLGCDYIILIPPVNNKNLENAGMFLAKFPLIFVKDRLSIFKENFKFYYKSKNISFEEFIENSDKYFAKEEDKEFKRRLKILEKKIIEYPSIYKKNNDISVVIGYVGKFHTLYSIVKEIKFQSKKNINESV
jgi:hypothetical protein